MPKNPKLDALEKQARLLRDRASNTTPGSAEATKLTRELNKLAKLIALYTEHDSRASKIADIENQLTAQARKDDTRLKVIVGAAVLADAELKPETRRGLVELVRRAVTAPRDRDFVQAIFTTKGWL